LLSSLQSLCRAEYAQWIIEDPADCEYRVVASLIPDAAESYDTAHRTGIIGQVFRAEQSILAMDVRNHPLYDTFDDSIDWELCFPVFTHETLDGVVNLEGAGELTIDNDLWATILRLVEETIGCQPPASLPAGNSAHFFRTRQFLIRTAAGENPDAVMELAQATAHGGEHTLLVGDYPSLVRGRGPSITEAVQRDLGISYCFFPVRKRLDLLATGLRADDVMRMHTNWWRLCDGRYEFVLIQAE
jgi:hypothetical protein